MDKKKYLKQAVVVGGSNGIGLAITNELISLGYHVNILDKSAPNKSEILNNSDYTYFPCDLIYFDEELFKKLSADKTVEILMITAGFGRVADFEDLHLMEIENLLNVNTVATIKIISIFYERIKSEQLFYCGIMGSIAGLISSPMFSVYAASKASIYRFLESVNIELEAVGIKNRILNVSPGVINGTKFNGESNDLVKVANLAKQILEQLFLFNTLFIPNYDEIYKDVLERYRFDEHKFGLSSYQYKLESGRVQQGTNIQIGYLSGTFDLFHVGHLNLIKRAKECCDYLIIGVHPDASHKGKETFIPFGERVEIVSSCKYVDKVVPSCAEDSEAWEKWKYHKLFVGSDYKGTERFQRYEQYFKDKGVEIIYFPYTQGTSSTQIRETIISKKD